MDHRQLVASWMVITVSLASVAAVCDEPPALSGLGNSGNCTSVAYGLAGAVARNGTALSSPTGGNSETPLVIRVARGNPHRPISVRQRHAEPEHRDYQIPVGPTMLPGCGDPTAGSCLESNGTPFCDVAFCCEAVCVQLRHCCELIWSEECAALAQAICTARQPCCHPNWQCTVGDPFECDQLQGVPLGPDAVCRGDCNEDGIDEACNVPGDLIRDGVLTLEDWIILHHCLLGPAIRMTGECGTADFNCDRAVDLRDVAIHQGAYGP